MPVSNLTSKTSSRALVFTATYNEVDNIDALLKEVWASSPEAHVLVVDDNSKDGTGELLDRIASKTDKLHIIHRPRKLGLGTAHKVAFKFAAEQNFDVLITMDADFSHNPSYIPQMLDLIAGGEDFVIGSRFMEGGSCDYSGGRLFVSRSANIAAKFLLGLKHHEATTSFRAFNRHLITKLDLDTIRQNGYSFFLESVYRISRFTEKTVEIPIHFEDRRMGTTKISRKELRKGFFTLLRLGFERFFSAAPKEKDETTHQDTCCNCNCNYAVELFPASVRSHGAVQYNCTSFHHSSHGRIVRCLGCNYVYTSPQLTPEQIVSLYSDVQDETYMENIPARESTFAYNFKALEPFLSEDYKLLDIGAYCGVFLDVVKKKGFANLKGIEPSKWASKYARDEYSLDVITGTLTDLDEKDKFDVITAWDVMEHFNDPNRELEDISRYLKDDGILAFSTLDIHNWFPRLMGERWPWYMDMHLCYFSDPVMKDILARSGFEVVESRNYCHIITARYFLEKLSSLGVPFMDKLAGLSFKGKTFGDYLSKFEIPFRFGDIKLYVCRKAKPSGQKFSFSKKSELRASLARVGA